MPDTEEPRNRGLVSFFVLMKSKSPKKEVKKPKKTKGKKSTFKFSY